MSMLRNCEEVEKILLERQKHRQSMMKVMLKGLEYMCETLTAGVDPKTHCLNNLYDWEEDYHPTSNRDIAVHISQDSWDGATQSFSLALWVKGAFQHSVYVRFEKENVTVEEVREGLRLKITNELKLKFKPKDLGPWWGKIYRVQTAMNELRQANTKCYQENGWAPLVDFGFEYRNPR